MKKYLLLIPLLTITLFPSFYTHALTDDYLTSVDNKYNTYTNDTSTYYDSSVLFTKEDSLNTITGPFYSMKTSHNSNSGKYTKYLTLELTSAINEMFDTTKLVEYSKDYYFDLTYYTKIRDFTNLDKGLLTYVPMYSYITNDISYLRNNREAFDNDLSLLNEKRTTFLYDDNNVYVHLGEQTCKVYDSENSIYKCRISYRINPDNFHKQANDTDKEIKQPYLVLDLPQSFTNPSYIYVDKLGLNDDLRGTDEMIPADEDLPNYDHVNDKPEKSLLDHIKDIFQFLIDLPGTILNGLVDIIKKLFVPQGDTLEKNISKMLQLIKEQLGFLYFPIDFIIQLGNKIINLPDTGDAIYTIPNVDLFGYRFINQQTFNLRTIVDSNSSFSYIYTIYRTIVSGIICFELLNLANRKRKEFIGGSNK